MARTGARRRGREAWRWLAGRSGFEVAAAALAVSLLAAQVAAVAHAVGRDELVGPALTAVALAAPAFMAVLIGFASRRR